MTMNFTFDEIKAKTAGLTIRNQCYVDGKFVDAASGKTYDCIDPANGKTITQIPFCESEDVDSVVAVARKAFEDGRWANLKPSDRKKILLRWADLMEAHATELEILETIDTGKTITDSNTVDIPLALDAIRWSAEAIDKVYGKVSPTGRFAVGTTTHEPLGVVAAIMPWNFPLYMAAWKLGPILATGNSMILKPAELTPLTSIRVAELATEAGIPDGVLNVLTGYGDAVGEPLSLHPDVDCISFTGSTAVGRKILKYSADSNMKRVSLECGGKSPAIIMPDADLDLAAEVAAWGTFYNMGECCDALSRMIVHESVKDEVLEKAIKIAKGIKVGDPLDPTSNNGAIVDGKQLDRIMNYIDSGKSQGAKIATGGNRILTETGGYFLEPTIFDEVDNKMTIAQEEIFGPVISTITFKDTEEAINIANDSCYGLCASIFTNDLNTTHSMAKALKVGAVWVNCFDAGDMSVPHGGYKLTGIGRDRSLSALDKYCEAKVTWIKLPE
jgi:4-guanidinobutyraldehyde dehydrogenase/NAD-dependent aldehyde dehydrogenase